MDPPVETHEGAPDRFQLHVRWGARWIAAVAVTAAALVVAGVTHARVADWIALVMCGVLGVTMLVTQAVYGASERSWSGKKSAALTTVRWSVAILCGLAGGLIVEATLSATAGAVLVAIALLALLVGVVAFAVRW